MYAEKLLPCLCLRDWVWDLTFPELPQFRICKKSLSLCSSPNIKLELKVGLPASREEMGSVSFLDGWVPFWWWRREEIKGSGHLFLAGSSAFLCFQGLALLNIGSVVGSFMDSLGFHPPTPNWWKFLSCGSLKSISLPVGPLRLRSQTLGIWSLTICFLLLRSHGLPRWPVWDESGTDPHWLFLAFFALSDSIKVQAAVSSLGT